MAKFNPDMDEKLISLVQERACIYATNHKEYCNVILKNEMWEDIKSRLNNEQITASDCKTRWTNIRDSYLKYKRKQKTTSGQSAKHIKEYKYARLLMFLDKYIDDRTTISSVQYSRSTEEENEEQVDDPIVEDSETFLANLNPSPLASSHFSPSPLPPPSTPLPLYSSTFLTAPSHPSPPPSTSTLLTSEEPLLTSEGTSNTSLYGKKKRKRPSSSDSSLSSVAPAMSRFLEVLTERSDTEQDSVGDFMNSMARTIRKFPTYLQRRAKTQILEVVNRCEEEFEVEGRGMTTDHDYFSQENN